MLRNDQAREETVEPMPAVCSTSNGSSGLHDEVHPGQKVVVSSVPDIIVGGNVSTILKWQLSLSVDKIRGEGGDRASPTAIGFP